MSEAKRRHCVHGNRVDLYVCPECHNEAMWKRQRQSDRLRFAEQLKAIRGEKR